MTPPIEPPRRPGAHGPTLGGERTVTGSQRSLRTTTPQQPPEDTSPSTGLTKGDWATLHGMILESQVQTEGLLRNLVLELIGNRAKAEETTMGISLQRTKRWAYLLGAALGTVMVFWTTAWSVYRNNSAEMTEVAAGQAAEAAVEAVAPAVAAPIAPLTLRQDATEQRVESLAQRLERLEAGVDRAVELLERENAVKRRP